MEKNQFLSSIRAAWDLLHHRLAIADAIINIGSLKVNPDFNAVALEKSSNYESIYRSAISLSHYNVILHDDALFQFSWISKSNWRLAFLPNPWLTGFEQGLTTKRDAQALLTTGELTQEEFDELLASLDVSNAVPPIRYEYALDHRKEVLHPASHLHIGRHTENRWGVNRKLSPKAFTMMIATQYYSESWKPLSKYSDSGLASCIDADFMATLAACNVVPDIPSSEKRLLHLTSG